MALASRQGLGFDSDVQLQAANLEPGAAMSLQSRRLLDLGKTQDSAVEIQDFGFRLSWHGQLHVIDRGNIERHG